MPMVSIKFEVLCDSTVVGQSVAVCGSGPLGAWDITKCLVLDGAKFPIWSGELQTKVDASTLEFKYVVVTTGVDANPRAVVRWEGDFSNRQLRLVKATESQPAEESTIVTHRFGESSDPQLLIFKSEDILGELDVKPSVRVRLVRSTSGKALGDKYEVRDRSILGTGMSGGVCLGKVRTTGMDVAVKTLPTKDLTERQLEQMLAEVQNQLAMDHPNICRLLEVYEEPGRIRMVMERMKGPDLYVQFSEKKRYTERDAASAVRQMCSAVAYCHRLHVCHRDLKLENFCLEDKSSDARLKLIDFGLSELFTSTPMSASVGTLFYVAPEVLRGRYDEKCDMWSLGVITYILLDGRAPFRGVDDRQTFRLIKAGVFKFDESRWAHISQNAKEFVSGLLCVDPSKRMSAEDAVIHPWLSEVEQGDAETPSLDPEVLRGMRNLTGSNALKRAVYAAIAPVATVEQVQRWADQFAQLDIKGMGTVPLDVLAKHLKEDTHASDPEIENMLEAFNSVDTSGTKEEVSYSAFLTACLFANPSLGDQQIRELFNRLDQDEGGRVEFDEIIKALSDVLSPDDVEELRAECDGNGLTYEEFRMHILGPRFGVNIQQLLGNKPTSEAWNNWKGDTRLAKIKSDDPDAALEARRRENAAWRMAKIRDMQGIQENVEEEEAPPLQPKRFTVEELRSADLPETAQGASTPAAMWAEANAKAKLQDPDASMEAARLENLAWRKWAGGESAETEGSQTVDATKTKSSSSEAEKDSMTNEGYQAS